MSLPIRMTIWLAIFLGLAYFAHRKSNEMSTFKRKQSVWPLADLLLYAGLRIGVWGCVFAAFAGAYGIYQNG